MNLQRLAWPYGWLSARCFLPSKTGCSRLSPATAGIREASESARAKAVELVGQMKFDAVWTDPWIGRYIQTSIRIYGQTIQGGNGGVPKLIFGSRWVIPEPHNTDDLAMILQRSLGVPKL